MKEAACGPLVALFVLLASGACSRASEGAAATPTPLRVFAAASLTASFQAIAAAFEQQHPEHRVELHFAGTLQLVLQLREGASADVFASADVPNMTKVQDLGALVDAPVEFARNQLVVVVRAGNPKGVRGLADLARADVKVALCGPEVPAGKYARQVLQRAGLEVRSVSDEPSVKAVVTKVQLGELDAALVYATDVAVSGVEGVLLPAAENVVASYPIGVLDRGGNRVGATLFVAFVRSEAARSILRRHGFVLP
ncbi:MAG: molybdate ABC transporter substrate-binding protein [Planctomycetes bacterium]|nr:molybdate ABC transporter substrate-binding protein [Planctomycetota bacterium]